MLLFALAFIVTTARASTHMKAIPSASLLLDASKRDFIDRMLNDVNMNLTQYIEMIINRTVVKPKQVLTDRGLDLLKQPEHEQLFGQLTKQYPLFMTNGTVCVHSNLCLIYKKVFG